MKCPVCDKPMVVLEIDQVELDHCVACQGTWLDAGELDLLLEGAGNRDALLSSLVSESGSRETTRRCPICDRKMGKVACAQPRRVLLDKCGRGHGLWFDRGELRDIIDRGEFPGENRIYRLLNDVFGGGA